MSNSDFEDNDREQLIKRNGNGYHNDFVSYFILFNNKKNKFSI